MEAASLVFSVAKTLFDALQSQELKQICSLWNCESDLQRLQDTVNTIKSVLLDAEAKDVLNHQQLNYVEKLRSLVYDADDLLDQFTALVEQKKRLLDGSKVPKKVRLLFSRFSKLDDFRKMSKKVKEIGKELDGIATNASQFCFKVNYEPIRSRRELTCSYARKMDFIGREKETEEIISMLLAPDVDAVQGDLSVLVIVGMGGLGKTTLAQLVYNHDKVISEFQLRFWARVADQDQNQLPIEPILEQVLESATGRKQDGSGIGPVRRQLRELLKEKKYLLVLDDVWTEDRNEWLTLKRFLMGGGRGSRIVVTTRSEMTAQVVGSITPYKLQQLSEENSWRLFERVAFDGSECQGDDHELEKIGKEIVKKCSNVPLAIQVVGSRLYGKEKKNWLEFRQCALAKIIQGDNTLMQTLKFSYHHLRPAMKSCFSYCALFPKDTIIEKEKLISLWMAQGYIEPLHEGQSIEDAGEDYFLVLVRRCFFQDVRKNELGEIVDCKMHDLIHDMAQQVAGKEICVADSTTVRLDDKVHHVFHDRYNNKDDCFFGGTKIRTYLQQKGLRFPASAISANWTRLRVLQLNNLEVDLQSLPDSIGSLLHLRYIDLSYNRHLKKLPESITQLHYLQTLILNGCSSLKELPNGFSKLGNLRLLDIHGCLQLSCMPLGLDKLTNLCRLTRFAVSEISLESGERAGGLEDLRALKDLRGHLSIEFGNNVRYVKEERREGGYLSNKKHLNAIMIQLDKYPRNRIVEGDEALLENLQPHENLKELKLDGYGGGRMPRWATAEKFGTSLPNLVKICLYQCDGLEELPWFSKLPHLKYLRLVGLNSLKHVENRKRSAEAPFFPSLEILDLRSMKKLKGWWRGSVSGVEDTAVREAEWASFPCLTKLQILGCPNIKSIPLCPTVETVRLYKFNERLQIMIAKNEAEKEVGCNSGKRGHVGSLRTVEIGNGRCLEWLLPIRAFRNLKEMKIEEDREMESLCQVGEKVLRSCSSSLRSLHLEYLRDLRNISGGGGLKYLTALESLKLFCLDSLRLANDPEEGEEEGMQWRCLSQSLLSLQLCFLPKVVNLPKGMQHLTSLQSLYIGHVNLEALPKWIGCLSSLQFLHIQDCYKIESLSSSMRQLTSLTRLEIWNCSERLHQRCRNPNGEDWPLIQHILYIDIKND